MRTRIESVLVPIDESAFAAQSLAVAKSLEPVQITLFHTVFPWPDYLRETLFPFAGMGEDEIDLQHDIIRIARTTLARQFEIEKEKNIALKIGVGALESISETLRTSDADLVIIGANGSNGMRFDGIGDVTNHVVTESKKPVLIIRDNTQFKRALTCVDLSTHASTVMAEGAVVSHALGSEMESMVVIPSGLDDVAELLQSHQAQNPKKAISRSKERVDAMFERATKAIELGFGEHAALSGQLRRRHVAYGSIVDSILARITETDVDLLVIGARHPDATHLGSNAMALIRRAPTNVLVVP